MPARSAQPQAPLTLTLAATLAGGLLCSSALGAVEADQRPVRTGVGVRPMGLQSPEALTSQADDGWMLRARVIVRAVDRGPIDRALGLRRVAEGPALLPVRASEEPGELREFWLIDTTSVAAAADLADALAGQPGVLEAYVDSMRPRTLRANPPTDPGFVQQWFINGLGGAAGSVNALPAWKNGITGTGITVGVIEAGFNIDHPDLAPNVNLAASQGPILGYTFGDHSTACAGLIAAARNGIGGVGVAYGAKISRQFFGFDSDTAASFTFRNDLNAVKSCSWGPPDNAILSAISSIELAALQTAATAGRGGKGTIFVWAAGNGAGVSDRVDYDPYASSRYAIAIGSIDRSDQRATYSEAGSSLMLVTTSSTDLFGSAPSGVYTTTGASVSAPGDYTAGFGGTSAAAPIASGAIALVLQANPNLSSRDVQHVLIRSARRVQPDDESWALNGAGRWVSDVFGFGAIDAAAAVALAPGFVSRGPDRTVASALRTPNVAVPDASLAGVSDSVVIPSNLLVERVQVILTAPHQKAGDLRILLTSPSGTQSLLADTREDYSPGYDQYTLASVRCWDERAAGTWTLRVADTGPGWTGTLGSWQLVVIGAPPACPVDFDASGTRTVADIFAFLSAWFNGLGDFNLDGSTGVDDIFAFLSAWFAGCP